MTAPLPDPSLPWPIAMTGVALICEIERCRLRAFKPITTDPWTVGWGATGDGIGPNTVWTQAFADQDLCHRLTTLAGQVRDGCSVEPNEHELAAMVSMAYNVGIGWDDTKPKPRGAKDGWRQSSVRKLHNKGDHQAAARAFDLWNKSAGQVLKGLTARRKREAALYLTPPPGSEAPAMPQAVEPESKPTASPTIRTGATITAGGIIAAAQEWGGQIGGLKPALDSARSLLVDTLGVPPGAILPLVMIGAGALVIYWRRRQRSEGWA